MRTLWRFFSLIELSVTLLLAACLVMAAGSFLLSGDYAAAINAMPLSVWLRETPVSVSWWLWLALVVLVLLALNTVICSTDLLAARWGRGNPFTLLAPQLIHAGFLLIMLAHLISSFGSYFDQIQVVEGSTVQLPGARRFGVVSLSGVVSPQGMPVGFSAELVTDLQQMNSRTVISPNHPWFINGYGVYLKHAELYPYKRALLEIHREPGAGTALAGALLFTLGNVLVVWQRSRVRETGI